MVHGGTRRRREFLCVTQRGRKVRRSVCGVVCGKGGSSNILMLIAFMMWKDIRISNMLLSMRSSWRHRCSSRNIMRMSVFTIIRNMSSVASKVSSAAISLQSCAGNWITLLCLSFSVSWESGKHSRWQARRQSRVVVEVRRRCPA